MCLYNTLALHGVIHRVVNIAAVYYCHWIGQCIKCEEYFLPSPFVGGLVVSLSGTAVGGEREVRCEGEGER